MCRKAIIIVLSLVAFTATGCGTMHIRTNKPGAAIYVDGRPVGTGDAEVDGTGFPKTSVIRVEYKGKVVERTVKRHFTTKTAIVGLFTYFTGFLWAWDFPDHVAIRFAEEKAAEVGGWDTPSGGDVWSKPMFAPPKKPEPPAKAKGQSHKAQPESSKKEKPKVAPKKTKSEPDDPWKKPIRTDT